MSIAINIENVDVVIKQKPILKKISGQIKEGAITGLLGPSGAGKTTLIRSFLGLQPIHNGKISIFDVAAGHEKLKSQVGYVTQAASVYADLTVEENVKYFASLLSQPDKEALRVIDEVELMPQKNQLAGSLSGGQMARVSLAVALLGQPKLLLLDEPTVGLDPLLRQKLWHTFHQLTAQGTTIVVSSHAMDEAQKCDELWFLRQGKLLVANTPQNILEQAQTKTMEEAFLALSKAEANL